ncbi:hypothetical protein [Thiovibrio frasassiensis]|uniref:Uncharacterized protein n=1 Tax=Thiovibrio frasassiensis TaxID=2984131 RepID=A0A9X4MIG0_9BACT|nr:hypothetical protein [Thiovibrio frasassiensis]MDG4476951.1 hypothetical protein [Thiovibrio frasassiensis]
MGDISCLGNGIALPSGGVLRDFLEEEIFALFLNSDQQGMAAILSPVEGCVRPSPPHGCVPMGLNLRKIKTKGDHDENRLGLSAQGVNILQECSGGS